MLVTGEEKLERLGYDSPPGRQPLMAGSYYSELVSQAEKSKQASSADIDKMVAALSSEIGPSAPPAATMHVVITENLKRSGVAISGGR